MVGPRVPWTQPGGCRKAVTSAQEAGHWVPLPGSVSGPALREGRREARWGEVGKGAGALDAILRCLGLIPRE